MEGWQSWLNAAVLKTVGRVTAIPGVRIPVLPLINLLMKDYEIEI